MKAALLACLLLACGPAAAQKDASFDELDRESAVTPEGSVDEVRASLDRQYAELLQKVEAQRQELRGRILRQWDHFDESSSKKWVDYSDKGDAVSKVDFEKGDIQVEVLVPLEDVTGGKKKAGSLSDLNDAERQKLRGLAQDKLVKQTQKALSEKDATTGEVLKGQVKAPDGKLVTPKSAPRFVRDTVAPNMQIEDKPIVAEDGKPRLKVTVTIPLVADHLLVRARLHKEQIEAAAKRYDLDPAFVCAVIHTESEFNPRARSGAPAFGLMQLMPKTAAREAYRFLYKEDKILPPDYLYDPDHNILLGATYLHLLQVGQFAKIKDPLNQRALMIAAYNCGPGCVRKYVLAGRDVNALSNAELLDVISHTVPKETREYVPRVQGRIELYRKL
jgi:membrane-bound lytic murein transglycosylase C